MLYEVITDQGGSYDRFRDRIMFPIRDRRGRVIGFGGRVLGDGTPKYLNSPETPLFHKGRELFGLFQVKEAHRSPGRILIVEGYMDVVALAQYGIDYAVASLGTSTTAEHMQLLFRTAPEVICCYDGDNAGREAAWRALENALPGLQDGRELKFVFLPSEHDPDSYVRALGREARITSYNVCYTKLLRSNDTWITSKIKTRMLAEKHFDSTRFSVVTEDGEVFLMGLVTLV